MAKKKTSKPKGLELLNEKSGEMKQVVLVKDDDGLKLYYDGNKVCEGPDTREFGQKTLNKSLQQALGDVIEIDEGGDEDAN